MDASRLQETIDWLMDGARSAADGPALMQQGCERLLAAGLPITRGAAFVRRSRSACGDASRLVK